jgi:hypothetical protein
MRDYCARIPFEKEKILSNTKVLGFTFTEKSAY